MKENSIVYGKSEKKIKQIPDNQVDLIYMDPPFFTDRRFNSFDDKWKSLEDYLSFMNQIIVQSHRVLKDTGSIYLHCDMHASHYLKIELDKVYSRKNNSKVHVRK